jgi:hypothetical protein
LASTHCAASCRPAGGSTSTISPFFALLVMRWPSGVAMSASGRYILPPWVTTRPVPAVPERVVASGIADDAVADPVGRVQRWADKRQAGRPDHEDVLDGLLAETAGDDGAPGHFRRRARRDRQLDAQNVRLAHYDALSGRGIGFSRAG